MAARGDGSAGWALAVLSAVPAVLACALVLALLLVLGLARRERRLRRKAESNAAQQSEAAARATKLRDEERRGRVRAEQSLREASTHAPSASPGADEEGGAGGGFVFNPIGTFKSCYRARCGTPRQGGVVPQSLAVLDCARDLNPVAALDGLEQYSHCWVLYVFHQNTNLQREGKTVARRRQQKGRVPLWQGLCMKVVPPRCPDLRVGVLACRTPHRPNPVGLSLARIVKIDAKAGQVVLAGLDVVDGTPCLDLKPYLPAFECKPSAAVPSWVMASYSEPLMHVDWSPSACEDLTALAEGKGAGLTETGGRKLDLRPFASVDELRRALDGTLELDIRSPLQKERHPNPGIEDGQAFFTGDLWFHDLHVQYSLLSLGRTAPSEAAARVLVERVASRQAELKGGA